MSTDQKERPRTTVHMDQKERPRTTVLLTLLWVMDPFELPRKASWGPLLRRMCHT